MSRKGKRSAASTKFQPRDVDVMEQLNLENPRLAREAFRVVATLLLRPLAPSGAAILMSRWSDVLGRPGS